MEESRCPSALPRSEKPIEHVLAELNTVDLTDHERIEVKSSPAYCPGCRKVRRFYWLKVDGHRLFRIAHE